MSRNEFCPLRFFLFSFLSRHNWWFVFFAHFPKIRFIVLGILISKLNSRTRYEEVSSGYPDYTRCLMSPHPAAERLEVGIKGSGAEPAGGGAGGGVHSCIDTPSPSISSDISGRCETRDLRSYRQWLNRLRLTAYGDVQMVMVGPNFLNT